MATPSRAKLFSAFAAIYIIWGSTYLAISFAVRTIPPFLMAGMRFLTAGLLLYGFAVLRGLPRPTTLQTRNAGIVGLFLLLGGNGAVCWAELVVPSGIAALLVAIVPLFLVLLNWMKSRTRPSLGVIIGVIVGFIGMIELVGLDSFHTGNTSPSTFGILALILGSLSWAIGTLYAKGADMSHSIAGTGMEMLIGGAGLILTGVLTGEWQQFSWHTVSRESLTGLLYLIVFGSLIAYTAYSWLIHNTSPSTLGTYAYVNPVVAVILGWLIANEPMTPRTLIGAAIIVSAVTVITTAQSRTAPAQTKTGTATDS